MEARSAMAETRDKHSYCTRKGTKENSMTNSGFTSLKIFSNERNLCEYLSGAPGTTSILALKMKR